MYGERERDWPESYSEQVGLCIRLGSERLITFTAGEAPQVKQKQFGRKGRCFEIRAFGTQSPIQVPLPALLLSWTLRIYKQTYLRLSVIRRSLAFHDCELLSAVA